MGLSVSRRRQGRAGDRVYGEAMKKCTCSDPRIRVYCDPEHHYDCPHNLNGSVAEAREERIFVLACLFVLLALILGLLWS